MKIRGNEVEVDIMEELSRYTFEKVRMTDDKMICCSPFRYEKAPSFFVRLKSYGDIDEGVWADSGGDGSYKAGPFTRLLAFLDGCTEEEIEEYLLDKYFITKGDLRLKLPKFTLDKPKLTVDPLKLENFEKHCQYLTDRGIPSSVQNEMNTRFDSDRKLAVIPWFDASGQIANVKYRSTNSKIFFYEKGATPIQKLIYGIDYIYKHNSKTVVLVEGEIDALTLIAIGIPAVALGGSAFGREKCDIIKRSPIQHLILATDNDVVGQNIRKNVVKALNGYLKLSNAYVPHPFKDVNECRDPQLLRDMVGNASHKKTTFFNKK